MASLEGQTIASTYKQLLKITSEGVGADASGKYVEDGLGTDTALSLSTTRVGIGTASPTTKFEVYDDTSGTDFTTVEYDYNTQNRKLRFGLSDGNPSIQGTLTNDSGTSLAINPSGGSVGIGVATPESILHIEGSGVDSLRFGNIGASSNSALRISRDDTSIISGNPLGFLEFGGKGTGSGVDTAHAYISAEASGTHASGDNPTDLTFGTTPSGTSTISERMRITSAGNVGIGTDNPSTGKLHVVNTGGTAYNQFLVIEGDTSDNNNYPGIVFKGGTLANNFPKIGLTNGGLATSIVGGYHSSNYNNRTEITLQGSDGSIQFATGSSGSSTTALTIDSSQNVGIGTTSPDTLLTLEKSLADNTFIKLSNKNTGLDIGQQKSFIDFDFVDSNANFTPQVRIGAEVGENGDANSISKEGSGAFVVYTAEGTDEAGNGSLTEKLRVDYLGKVGIGHTSPQYGLTIAQGSTDAQKIGWEDGGNNKRGAIYVNPSNDAMQFMTGTSDAVRMTISSTGNVSIGTDSTGGNSALTLAVSSFSNGIKYFASNGQASASFEVGGSVVGSITHTASATAFNESSDYRLKENEVPISDALTRLNQLKPYRFNFIVEPDITVDGFFAHEVAEIVPEAVTGEKDAVDDEGNIVSQGIDKSKLVPLLVKAVQELSAKVEALENA